MPAMIDFMARASYSTQRGPRYRSRTKISSSKPICRNNSPRIPPSTSGRSAHRGIWIPEVQSPLLPFTLPRCYASEMGDRLWGKFIIFQPLTAKDELISIKQTTLQIEEFFSVGRNGLLCRRINLDPGYLTL